MIDDREKRIRAIGEILRDTQKPLKQRFRALFTLRNLKGPVAVDCIAAAFTDSSVLLKHELAYCLGQMQDEYAIPVLIRVLEDINQEPMVRHEAGEALGAIGAKDVISVLEKYKDDPVIEVAETCQLAIQRIKWLHNEKSENEYVYSPYMSVDPTPSSKIQDVNELEKILLSDEQSLYDRYKAMFALRNIGSPDASVALAKGLRCGSALFRHEVGYVLGQLQQPVTVPYLIEALEDLHESEMVRHECAEALGAIANDDCQTALQRFADDDKRVVKESCVVALDMCEYVQSEEFQYADALQTVSKSETNSS